MLCPPKVLSAFSPTQGFGSCFHSPKIEYDAVEKGMFVKRDLEGGQMSRDMTLFVRKFYPHSLRHKDLVVVSIPLKSK